MIYKVILIESAKNDIINICKYISFALSSSISAKRLYKKLIDAIKNLETMPERFQRFNGDEYLKLNLRAMLVDKYVVIYSVDNNKQEVNVIRVLYKGQNVNDEFEKHFYLSDNVVQYKTNPNM